LVLLRIGSISKTVMEYIDGSLYTIVLSKNTGGEQ